MERFTNSIRQSIDTENWYGALVTALALPDVCGWLEDPDKGSKARYVEWFKDWLQPTYTHGIGPDRQEHVFLHGEDCYALRCSLLHQGGSNIEEQRAQKALEDFHFITPPPGGGMIHCNQVGNKLQLQVDVFCNQMADAADHWYESRKECEGIQKRMDSLLIIHDSSGGVRF
ncbi:hypothetical protein [Cycloclasticus pugetii]|uniref:hypothetical protein n=1 Tax=Cycloclasticus pugetii TaxID=34068 RepID=UPI003A955FF2